MSSGALYLVGTPIGNLEDITFRAVRVLREADVIACEDTRQSRKLLDHYGIGRPLISYHEHNEKERSVELAARLRDGAKVALISDAGMPLVSDPGYRLVREALDAGVPVHPIPGPTACMTAIAASGLPPEPLRFGGFLPAKAGARGRLLEALATDPATLVFYEAPHRVLEALADLERLMPRRPVVVARELTKLHEEFLRGTASEVRAALEARPTVRGEITLLVGPGPVETADPRPVAEAVAALVAAGTPPAEAVKMIARERGLPKREVYREFLNRE
ncbi:MAG: 16S rRNA (cytidine(1402)-2'-O)-methyltransferase [Bryobacterales bacterium]|nr:16S rRNA (cytidine(1402)-2'-O)-methyltransferase [Bryobacterales bacterium]